MRRKFVLFLILIVVVILNILILSGIQSGSGLSETHSLPSLRLRAKNVSDVVRAEKLMTKKRESETNKPLPDPATLPQENEKGSQPLPLPAPVHEALPVINIVTATCSGEKNFTDSSESTVETLIMIKSVLISMKLYHLDEKVAVHIHIFTDSKPLTDYLQTEIGKYLEAVNGTGSVHFQTSFYSSLEPIPQTIVKTPLTPDVHICMFSRLFFPEVLPPEVKTALYLDTDVIVTGNIEKIWNDFSSPVVQNKSILAGLIGALEPDDTKYTGVFNYYFKGRPHVPPKGVNSGIMFMNVEGMRQANWTLRCNEIFQQQVRRKEFLNDQAILNEYFHFNMDKLQIFGCQYNFVVAHCERGWACKTATEDPAGIQLFHGASGSFHRNTSAFFSVFQAFKKFNLSEHAQAVEKLLIPLKKSFHDNLERQHLCEGFFSSHLFPQINSSQLNSTSTSLANLGKIISNSMLNTK